MLRNVLFLLIVIVALASSITIFADPLVLPDMGITADDVLESGLNEVDQVVIIGTCFLVAILLVFFGYSTLKRVLDDRAEDRYYAREQEDRDRYIEQSWK